MLRLRDISINGKLKIVIMTTSSIALLVAAAAFVTYDQVAARKSMASDLDTLAKVIGANCTAALAFGDSDSAKDVLSALSAKQPVIRARLFSPDATIFAEYLRDVGSEPGMPEFGKPVFGSRFEGGYLIACEPVVLDGETIGTLCVESDLEALNHEFREDTRLVAIVLLGSLLVALVISTRLQRLISGPISHLAETARAVSLEKDYSIRAVRTSGDELGMLIDGFNEMLTQIQGRDVELQNARDQLEGRVEERTAQLQQEISERKQAEQTLRHSEERNRALVDAIPDAMARLSREGVYLDVRIPTGFPVDAKRREAVGLSVSDAFPREVADRSLDSIHRALATGEMQSLEFEVLVGDQRRFREARIVVCGNEEVILLIRDITEHKQIEEMNIRRTRQIALRADVGAALADRSADLRQTLDYCMQSVVRHLDAAFARLWTLNTELNVLELQASAGMYTHIDGAHARIPVGAFKIGLIAQERHPHITNDVQGDPRVSDKEWAKREGMIAFAGYPLMVGHKLVGVMAMFCRTKLTEDTLNSLGSISDIVSQAIERRQAEEALRRSEERSRALIDAIPDTMTRLTRDGIFLDVRVPKDFPFPARSTAIIGKSVGEVLPGEVGERLMECVDRVMETGEMQSIDFDIAVGDQLRFREARVVACGED